MNIQIQPNSLMNLKQITQQLRPAALRALNKTARMVEVQANRQIRGRYNLKRSEVDAAISSKAASISKLTAMISAKGKPLKLYNFGRNQTKKGVPVIIIKGQRKIIAHAFYAIMKTGHAGVFQRTSRKRLPIKELTTISIAQMFGTKVNREKLINFFYEKLPEVLRHEIKFFLDRKNKT